MSRQGVAPPVPSMHFYAHRTMFRAHSLEGEEAIIMADEKAKEYFLNLDLKENSIKNFVVDVAAAEPMTGGKLGQVKSYNGYLYISNGTQYNKLGVASSADEVAERVSALETWMGSAKTDIAANATKSVANETAISGLDTRLGTAEGKITTAEGKITTLEGEMDTAQQDIDALEVIVSGADGASGLVKAVADNTAAIGELASADNVYTKTEIDGKVDAINTEVGKKLASTDAAATYQTIAGMSEYYKTTQTYSSSQIDDKISAAVSSVYNVKGTVADEAALNAVATKAKGDVYNITAASTYGPAGTNVVWDGSAWDALGGTYDLSPYAKTADVNAQVETLQTAINGKVAQTVYDAKISSIESTIQTLATTEALNSGLNGKVDKSTYATDKTALETSIGQKVVANTAITGATKCKITYDAKGLVTAGADLTVDDLPADIPVAKLSGLDAAVKAVRFMQQYTAETSQTVAHGLGVQYPQVMVYNTTSGCVIGCQIKYVDANTVEVSGNVALGAITVVVSP